MNQLSDAVKSPIAMPGFALLQWGFPINSDVPTYSLQMPEKVIDQILIWRDQNLPNDTKYEFSIRDISLPHEEWLTLTKNKYSSLSNNMLAWLTDWQITELKWHFDSDDERIAMRTGHFIGWFNGVAKTKFDQS